MENEGGVLRVAAVQPVLPAHRYDQASMSGALREMWGDEHPHAARVADLHRAAGVQARHLALPLPAYADLGGFGDANDAWIRVGVELGEAAVRGALDAAGLAPTDVDALWTVSVTGLAAPSLDARLVNRLGLRRDVRRVPIFGLGCVGGAAGLARVADHLRGAPDHVAVLLSVELCSLTFQRDDRSVASLIAGGLFGDGAAAAVVVGAGRASAGPRIVATRSAFYPDTEHVMGWDVRGSGFRIVLSGEVPAVAEQRLRPDVDAFLADHGLDRGDVGVWVAHTGGPKVLEAMQRGLELPEGALDRSWRSLAAVGNLSSASVLFVLADVLASPPPPDGTWGLLLAMGPGFCAELVLLRWGAR